VLQAPGIELAVLWNVQAQLVAGVGVQRVLHLGDGLPDTLPIAVEHGLLDQFEVLGLEHVAVWEGQSVDRVVWCLRPVDQLVHYIAADLERKNLRHHARIVREIGIAGALADEPAQPVAADRPGSKRRAIAVGNQGHFFTSASPQSKSTSSRTSIPDISECRPV
jgi:hypothetical protein